VVVLIHGGFWRSTYTKVLMGRLARAVVSIGLAAWNVEYRRIGPFGGGGGWPATFDDVDAAVAMVARLPGVDGRRYLTCGHSAGGQLALWAARSWPEPPAAGRDRGAPALGAVALAGVLDLRAAYDLGLGGGAVARLLGGTPDGVPDRYDEVSPAALVPLGVPQVLIHGTADTVVPPSMSSGYERLAASHGDEVLFEPVEGAGHRQMIDPRGPAWSVLAPHLRRLLGS